jgi:DNA adenine methylase
MHISNQINTVPYLGSKFSVLPWLLPKLPHTLSFTEVFGGSMVVMMNKEPCQIETYNDINSGVVNFFRVLRDYPEELISKLYLTPHSREEYDEAWENDQDDQIEKARKYFVRMRQSFYASGAQKQKKGWLSATRQTRCKVSEATNKYLTSVDGLHQIVERLKMIQIERWTHCFAVLEFEKQKHPS